MFAARGYEKTTIRAVASLAGADPSMVIRYDGSKAGLFNAAAATPNLSAPDLTTVPADQRGELLVRDAVSGGKLRDGRHPGPIATDGGDQ